MSRPKKKREDILKSATHVFGDKGFHSANIVDIAEQAGIGKGTVYEYFESKSALFIEVMRFNTTNYVNLIKDAVNAETTFMNQFNAYMAAHHEIIRENYATTGIFINTPSALIAAAEGGKEVVCILLEAHQKVTKIIGSILTQGMNEKIIKHIDIPFVSDMIFQTVNRSAVRISHHLFSDQEIKTELEHLIDFIFNGITLSYASKGDQYVI